MILAVIKVGVQERCHVENLSRNAICCKEPMIIAGKERLYFCTLSSIHGIFSSAQKVSKCVVKQQFKSQLNRQPWCMVWNLSKLKQLVVVTALKHVSTSQNYTNKSAKLKMQSICTSLLSKTNSPVSWLQGYTHEIMGRRFPDGGLLRYRKWVPQQLGDVPPIGLMRCKLTNHHLGIVLDVRAWS